MGRPIVHWELMSKDPAKVSDFYAKIFGWKIQHHPEMNYRIVDTGSEAGTSTISPPIARRSSRRAARSTSKSRRSPAWASSRSSPIPRAA